MNYGFWVSGLGRNPFDNNPKLETHNQPPRAPHQTATGPFGTGIESEFAAPSGAGSAGR